MTAGCTVAQARTGPTGFPGRSGPSGSTVPRASTQLVVPTPVRVPARTRAVRWNVCSAPLGSDGMCQQTSLAETFWPGGVELTYSSPAGRGSRLAGQRGHDSSFDFGPTGTLRWR